MQLVGITVFSGGKVIRDEKRAAPTASLINTMDITTRLSLGKRVKAKAIQFIKNRGIEIGKNASYAVRQEHKAKFWINPRTARLLQDWEIILNDNKNHQIIVLRILKESISLKIGNNPGLIVRSDRPEVIDLTIDCNSIKDRRSGVDFSPYVFQKIAY